MPHEHPSDLDAILHEIATEAAAITSPGVGDVQVDLRSVNPAAAVVNVHVDPAGGPEGATMPRYLVRAAARLVARIRALRELEQAAASGIRPKPSEVRADATGAFGQAEVDAVATELVRISRCLGDEWLSDFGPKVLPRTCTDAGRLWLDTMVARGQLDLVGPQRYRINRAFVERLQGSF